MALAVYSRRIVQVVSSSSGVQHINTCPPATARQGTHDVESSAGQCREPHGQNAAARLGRRCLAAMRRIRARFCRVRAKIGQSGPHLSTLGAFAQKSANDSDRIPDGDMEGILADTADPELRMPRMQNAPAKTACTVHSGRCPIRRCPLGAQEQQIFHVVQKAPLPWRTAKLSGRRNQ